MATYKGIQGYSVQNLSSDPTASSATEGQLWYNSSTGKFRVVESAAGAWASGGAMNRANAHFRGCCGTQTAGLVATGAPASPPGDSTNSETYDGSAWTEVNNNNTFRSGSSGAGTQTAGIIFGGGTFTALTETYDGTNWTEVADLNTARYYGASATAAPQTTARYFSGQSTPGFPGSPGVENESWNGTSWTEEANLNTKRQGGTGAGTTDSALVAGGYATVANCETWNGTSWTEVADLNVGSGEGAGCGASNASALQYGGSPPGTGSTRTEKWDGSSWTEVAVMATGTYGRTSIGTANLALAGGGNVSATGQTEEWNDPVYSIKTVTVS